MADGFELTSDGYQIIKDPEAVLDYSIDWSAWLVTGDTISLTNWTVPTGLTLDSSSKTTTVATAWLSGGTVGTEYLVTCHVTTVAGRKDDRSFKVIIADR